MRAGSKVKKYHRLEVRVTPELKAMIQRAAALAGCSVTGFIVRNLQEAVTETIRTHEILELSAQDSEAFAVALLTPPHPNERLIASAQRHREFLWQL